ncbi:DNA polymerase [Acrasis kona]|uniref:DNA polymerase n=1 Tax=Acrasis kona TaxID=1008807 RepID=A0AAW2YMA4_9EUKA
MIRLVSRASISGRSFRTFPICRSIQREEVSGGAAEDRIPTQEDIGTKPLGMNNDEGGGEKKIITGKNKNIKEMERNETDEEREKRLLSHEKSTLSAA